MAAPAPFSPLIALDLVALDTETTGLDAASARLLQIGAVRLDGAAGATEVFVTLVDPGIPIPARSTGIHGIGDDDVAGAPGAGEALARLAAFVGDAVVVGHSIGFDIEVLRREAERAGIAWSAPTALDIRPLAEAVLHDLAGYDLDALCAHLGITIAGRHTAPGDARAAADVFTALLPRLRERGVRTLAEAQALAHRVRRREGEREPAPAGPALEAGARIDPYAYRHRVADLMSTPAAMLDGERPLREALALMIERGVSSTIVAGADGEVGIVTERDVLRAVGRLGVDALDTRLAESWSAPLVTVAADDPLYRAIGRMERLGIRHLGVVDASGAVVGAVTTRNLLRHRASAAMVLGDEIEAGEGVAGLAAAWGRVPETAMKLAAEEVDPRTIASVISAEIRTLTRRAAEIAAAELGPAPVPYAVLVLGSAGRGESLLAADQDNAIVHAGAREGGAAEAYFARLGARIATCLDGVGIPYCKGGVMAREPAWCQSLHGWRRTVAGWIGRQQPEDLLNVDIFFDAAIVHGDRSLGEGLLADAWGRARRTPSFLVALAGTARDWRSPARFLGGFRTGADGRLDLKAGGLLPIVAAARVLAIKAGAAGRARRLDRRAPARRRRRGPRLAEPDRGTGRGAWRHPRRHPAPADRRCRRRGAAGHPGRDGRSRQARAGGASRGVAPRARGPRPRRRGHAPVLRTSRSERFRIDWTRLPSSSPPIPSRGVAPRARGPRPRRRGDAPVLRSALGALSDPS